MSTLKQCSILIINETSDYKSSLQSFYIPWNEIVIEGLESPDDTTTISDLVKAAQHENKTKTLKLGFKTIKVPSKRLNIF